MQSRARLLKQYQTHLKKQASYIVEGSAGNRRALRRRNQEQIKQHPEWFPTPLKASDRRWQALAENNRFLNNDHLHNITEVAIHHLGRQLDRPYVWGSTRPDRGFDYSGLVFYAYNKIFEAKLLRTINEMYHYHRTMIVVNNNLCRGDLLLFHIHSRETTDHMEVYLDDGQFIKSPRTGKNIRASRLTEPFWQDHFLGVRRILTEETTLQAGQGTYAASGGCARIPDATLTRLIMPTSLCIFASHFPVILSPHYRPFLSFLPLRKKNCHV